MVGFEKIDTSTGIGFICPILVPPVPVFLSNRRTSQFIYVLCHGMQ